MKLGNTMVSILLAGSLAALEATGGVAQERASTTNSGADVEAVGRMLDSWNGQGEILEEARRKLAPVLQREPMNYLALKEAARYKIMAGYINEHWAQNGRTAYLVGNYIPGTLESAEATVREALRINPRFAEGYVLLGYILQQQTRLDEAAKALTEAESLGTSDPWLQLNWADVLAAQGNDSAAADRWQRVLRSRTTNAKAYSAAFGHLIEQHKKAGEHDKVMALYEEQIRRNPSNAWQRGNFASYLNETLGRNDDSIAQARAALKIMDYGVGRRILAMALYGKWADLVAEGKDAEGERYFKEAHAIRSDLDRVMANGASHPKGDRLARALISKRGVSIDALDDDGSSALLIATNQNRAQAVRFLLDLNANPSITDRNGWTPLLSAADEGNREIVEMLLTKGADMRATMRGRDPAAMAEKKGYVELAEMLRKRAAEAR